ncbi:MAG TPA: non-canonical purine NTP pyrophosphatase [Candidatus Moranbacteria bacterium]|nr:non-canonical purine NTP pyrophosphatase [Candidatus Moranbacteria bacterium]
MKKEKITFITGNQKKADYLAKFLGFPVEHVKLDLDEIQSLDLLEVVEHKVRQAYAKIKKPVLVEDSSLEFKAFGRLPGPFIRFFVDEISFKTMCAMLPSNNRKAVAHSAFGYYDGKTLKIIEGKLEGTIAKKPSGDNGFDWDKIFIPKGYSVTRARLNSADYKKTYLKFKPFAKLKKFLGENYNDK